MRCNGGKNCFDCEELEVSKLTYCDSVIGLKGKSGEKSGNPSPANSRPLLLPPSDWSSARPSKQAHDTER